MKLIKFWSEIYFYNLNIIYIINLKNQNYCNNFKLFFKKCSKKIIFFIKYIYE